MKMLVIGQDGRTHALIWKLFDSPQATEIVCAPGNGGTSQLVPSVDLPLSQVEAVSRWAFDEQIDLIVPASSASLYAGLVDEVIALHVGVFGPPQRATRIEQSRCYTKEFLLRHSLPTATGQVFSKLTTAEKYLAAQPLPLVIKADYPGITSTTYQDRYSALNALRDLFATRSLEGSNDGVVIETFLPGIRVSFSAITDGHTALPLLPTRIYDRWGEGDTGAPAPSMGAHTGISTYASKLTDYLHQRLMLPLVRALHQDNLPYWGILGIDCIITPQGPRISALRCSLHDMEAQVVLPRLEDDLLTIMQSTITRRLDQLPPLTWRDEVTVGIALVAQGYPHHFPIGSTIEGLTQVDPGILIFHDQTNNPLGLQYRPTAYRGPDPLARLIMGMPGPGSTITTTGGHVLTVVAFGATLNGARGRALINAERITFAGRYYRGDIGQREFN